ncbi:MAG: ATP-binding protein [Acidobacteriota bacterium]
MAPPLRRRFAVAATAVSIPLLALTMLSGRLTYLQEREELAQETRTTAVTVVAYLNRMLTSADSVAVALAEHPAVRQLDEAALAVVLPRLTTALVENIVVATPAGRPVSWARAPEPSVEGALDPSFLARVAAVGRMQVSRVMGQPGAARHAVVIAYPVRDEGRTVAALGFVVRTEAAEDVLRNIPLPPGSVVTLSDDRSVVVARSRESAAYVGRAIEAPGQSRSVEDVPSSVIRVGVDGVERVFANDVVERGGWLVSVGIPTAVAWERSWPIMQRNLAILVGGAVLISALMVSLGRRYLKAFDYFEAAAARVAAGDFRPPPRQAMPVQELERLQAAFTDMAVKLQRAHDAIEHQIADERRMRGELQSLQQQVIRQERLAAIGVLVSGVAHELNNPLQAILGFAELLQIRHELPQSVRDDLGLIQRESARASAIIRNLSRFGRQQAPDPTAVLTRDLLEAVVELRQRKCEEQGILLEIEDRARTPMLAVFTELQQVLLNFVINAEQAVMSRPDGQRRITIRTLDADGRVRVEVEDSGAGVPPEHEAKLFQPFFTTKPVGEGTGLGLSVSYGIVESYGGTIGYRKASTGGALFFFELPALTEEDLLAE